MHKHIYKMRHTTFSHTHYIMSHTHNKFDLEPVDTKGMHIMKLICVSKGVYKNAYIEQKNSIAQPSTL